MQVLLCIHNTPYTLRCVDDIIQKIYDLLRLQKVESMNLESLSSLWNCFAVSGYMQHACNVLF